jgi:hypothetical protein
MKHFTMLTMVCLSILYSPDLLAQCACSGNCDFTITTATSDVDFTASELKTLLGVTSLAGKRICIQAGTYTNKRITFRNVEGTASQPVIIKNCGGQVIINNQGNPTAMNAIVMWDVKYIKLLGNSCAAAPDNIQYGIRAKSNANYVEASALATGGITDIEMAWLDIGADPGGTNTAGAAGVKIIDQPGCDQDTISNRNSPNRKVIRNILVHDNYIHNTGDEGIYIGKGDSWYPAGGFPTDCPSTRSWSNSIKGARIYNNRIENTGWDGLQLKDGDEDVKIYNNDIRNYGLANNGAQNEGMVLGAGVVGDVYHNLIINGTGWGLFYKGLGNLNFHNNLIANTGEDGMYLNGNEGVTTAANSYLRIVNNTIVKTGQAGVTMFNYNTLTSRILVNNIIAEVDASSNVVDGTFTEKNFNLENRDASQLLFVNYEESAPGDFLTNDYHLQQGSPAVDAGKDASVYPVAEITYDFDGTPRNFNGAYDIGCYEYNSDGLVLLIDAGGNGFNDWEADNPHSTLDNSILTYTTGSQASFFGANATSAPDEVLGTYRYNLNAGTTIRYNIPVPVSGEDYEVELFFARKNADTWTSGARRFNIIIEGQSLTTYDVYDQGGPGGTGASSYTHTATVNDGMLEVKLVAVGSAHSMINAIRIEGPVGSEMQSRIDPEVVPDPAEETSGIFPNPAYDHINITSARDEIVGVKITSVQNEVHLSAPLHIKAGESRRLDISGLHENQMYIVHLQSVKGVRTFKLLKVAK